MAKSLRSRAGKSGHDPRLSTTSSTPRPQTRKPAAQMPPPAPPVAPVAEFPVPSAEAVSVFQNAMQLLQRHRYSDAAGEFRALLDRFPREAALRERSQVYLALCDRELKRQPAAPRTIEERLTAATAALNDDDEAGAESLAKSGLADAPQHDLALYLLAAVEARRGANDAALRLLIRAAAVSPEIRAQARHDADFEDLHDLDAFRQLIDPPQSSGPRAGRRTRRGRSER